MNKTDKLLVDKLKRQKWRDIIARTRNTRGSLSTDHNDIKYKKGLFEQL